MLHKVVVVVLTVSHDAASPPCPLVSMAHVLFLQVCHTVLLSLTCFLLLLVFFCFALLHQHSAGVVVVVVVGVVGVAAAVVVVY